MFAGSHLFDETFISKIECFLESRNNGDFSLRRNSLHSLSETVAFFLHEELANHGCRPTLAGVEMHQHRVNTSSSASSGVQGHAKYFRPIASAINKLDDLDLFHSKLICFDFALPPIQIQN